MQCSFNLRLNRLLAHISLLSAPLPKDWVYVTSQTTGEFLIIIPKHKQLRHRLHSSHGYCILGYFLNLKPAECCAQIATIRGQEEYRLAFKLQTQSTDSS